MKNLEIKSLILTKTVESVVCQLIIFSSEMYRNDQWSMIYNGNVISIKCFQNYFADERT